MQQKTALIAIVPSIASLATLMALVGECQPAKRAGNTPTRRIIAVYGFSTEEEVFTEEIFPAFQMHWQGKAGQEIVFQGTFTSSEYLAEAIMNGAPADVAILPNEQHAVWLRINDLVKTDWHTLPNAGIVTRSPLVIVVRPGNPLRIKDWADLARPDVRLVHADPRTSGGAQWALLAEYGSMLLGENGSTEAARDLLRQIWANVIVAPSSSREALKQFVFGVGDVLATYEQDALLAQARGAEVETVIPRSTIMSEHVVVIVDRNVKSWERETVDAFVAFLWSETAQEAFTRYYFRAVTDDALNEAVAEFHKVEQPFTVQDLGGWGRVYPEVIHWAGEELVPR